MTYFSTTEAARKLGVTQAALSKYIKAKKVPAPQTKTSGKTTIHLWTEEEVENLRQLLPKIANGRKTRYKKKQTAPTAGRGRPSSQQSAKTKGKTKSKKKK